MTYTAGLLFAALIGDVPTPSTTEVRHAIERALPIVQKNGEAWIDAKKCASCHQVTSMIWSHRAAARVGIPVAAPSIADWSRFSIHLEPETRLEPKTAESDLGASDLGGSDLGGSDLGGSIVDEPDLGESDGPVLVVPGGGLETIARLVLAGATDGRPDTEAAALRRILREAEPDGTWKATGQIPEQRREVVEAHEAATMWAWLAIRRGVARGTMEGDSPAVHAIPDFAASAAARESTEWHAVRLLVELSLGDDERARDALARLRERQHEDGGFGFVTSDPSDALATGLALYSLERATKRGADAETTHTDPDHARTVDSRERAVQFLLTTQNNDGAWTVPSTLSRKKRAAIPTSNDWGTAWAIIGLAETLPAAAAPTEEAGPR